MDTLMLWNAVLAVAALRLVIFLVEKVLSLRRALKIVG
jgi:hypothetical protein